MHVLLDTNVPLNMWLAPTTTTRPMAAQSALVMDAAAKRLIHAYITPVIFSNVFYFLRKELGQAKAITLCDDLVVHTSMLAQDAATFRKVLASGWPDVEDAAQYFAAKADPRITHICTSNGKHFKGAVGIAVLSPAELLRLL